ncbi:MAG TPA: hypothetical protein VFH87_10675, partial [Candidatus Udaeobacter sp.]|nr:hypothetical protein [Candidatus Udaeobacter sp.]
MRRGKSANDFASQLRRSIPDVRTDLVTEIFLGVARGLTGIGGSGYSYTEARSALISASSDTELALLRQRQIANATNKRSRATKIATYVS